VRAHTHTHTHTHTHAHTHTHTRTHTNTRVQHSSGPGRGSYRSLGGCKTAWASRQTAPGYVLAAHELDNNQMATIGMRAPQFAFAAAYTYMCARMKLMQSAIDHTNHTLTYQRPCIWQYEQALHLAHTHAHTHIHSHTHTRTNTNPFTLQLEQAQHLTRLIRARLPKPFLESLLDQPIPQHLATIYPFICPLGSMQLQPSRAHALAPAPAPLASAARTGALPSTSTFGGQIGGGGGGRNINEPLHMPLTRHNCGVLQQQNGVQWPPHYQGQGPQQHSAGGIQVSRPLSMEQVRGVLKLCVCLSKVCVCVFVSVLCMRISFWR